MATIDWSNQVFDDIDTIADYLSQRSTPLAKAFVSNVFRKSELLENSLK